MGEKKKNIDQSQALSIIDFWFTIEFLNQESMASYYKMGKQAARYKEELKRGMARKKSVLQDFIPIRQNENVGSILEESKKITSLMICHEFTLFLGKAKREDCVQKIARNISWDDVRPEQCEDEVALAAVRFTEEGRLIKESFSLSPLIWAVSRLEGQDGDISSKLSSEKYISDVKKLEEHLKDIFTWNEENRCRGLSYDVLCRAEEVLTEYLHCQDLVSSHSFSMMYKLYEKEEDIGEGEEAVNLHFDCFSDDLALIREKIKNHEISKEKCQELEHYILGIYKNYLGEVPERTDVVKPENKEDLYQFYSDILTAEYAPVGKWPSKYMPVLMQQIAINLATSEKWKLPVFSVNGPPGTGKTTLLKEVVVDHIVKKARLLAEYENADDAFISYGFHHGSEEQHAYNKWVKKYHRMKNKKIADYSILVASSNNTAVENITKELPVESKILKDINPKGITDPKNQAGLSELCELFSVEKSKNTITYTEERWESYIDAQGEKKKRKKIEQVSRPDIYFSKLAETLLNDDFGKKEKEPAFGLISASLGKRANILKVETDVIAPLVNNIMKRNDSLEQAESCFQTAKKEFLAQWNVVTKLRKKQDSLLKIEKNLVSSYEQMEKESRRLGHQKQSYEFLLRQTGKNIEEAEKTAEDGEKRFEELNRKLSEKSAEVQEWAGQIQSIENELEKNQRSLMALSVLIKPWDRIFNKAKVIKTEEDIRLLQEQQKVLTEYLSEKKQNKETLEKEKQELQRERNRICTENRVKQSALEKLYMDQEKIKGKLEKSLNQARQLKKDYKSSREDYRKERENYENQLSYERGFVLDAAYVDDVLSDDVDTSTAAQVKNPWFSEHYNREREKLFWHALQVTKYFILSSKKCRDNLKHLDCLWSGSYSDNVEVKFLKEDLEHVTEAAFETLFLLIPVVSSTFASIQSLFRNVKEENLIGTLIVDEAGQASPHMALGALYRCRRAMIVGDPKQVEPVVTDDQDLLKQTYTEDIFHLYANKSNSVQKFADEINPYGTYLENEEGEKEWVGCPLLVHRRCISPMYDISNDISYNNMMKQQTLQPDKELAERFIFQRSQWINVAGSEVGRKNHFVEKQGEKVVEMLETACERTTEPDLYIISPFKSVVHGIKTYIRGYKESPAAKNLKNLSASWAESHIGTVHKFQGKEAAEVIFLLGCDISSDARSAIKWVNNNIVNVAATRAKYRLYMIGDIKAWSQSKCISRAKTILDIYPWEALEQELEKENPDHGILENLSKQLPSSSAFPIAVLDEANEESPECVTSTAELIQEFDKTNIMLRPLSSSELRRFGFYGMEELDKFDSEVRANLVLGMKLFFLLEKTYQATKVEMDASCCGILFCKAMELQMYHCFVNGLKQHFPDYTMRVKAGKDGTIQEVIYLKDADPEEFTLGWYPGFIKKEKSELGNIMNALGHEKYNSVWWDDFKSKLFRCKEERNHCCHTRKFYWSNLEQLINFICCKSITKHEIEMGGLIFESETGLYLQDKNQNYASAQDQTFE